MHKASRFQDESSNPRGWKRWKTTAFVATISIVLLCLSVGHFKTSKPGVAMEKKSATQAQGQGVAGAVNVGKGPITVMAKADLKNFPNMGFVSQGYNIFGGAPEPQSLVDPGWTVRRVASLDWNSNVLTPDGRYKVPKHVQAQSLQACATSASSSQMSGQQSIFKRFQQSVTLSGGYSGLFFSAAFSASVQYQSMSHSVYTQHKTYYEASAKCAVYQASLLDTFTIDPAFVAAVANLPLTFNEGNVHDPYYNLLRDYGTHYATTVVMGSKIVRVSEFTAASYAQMEYNKLDIAASAKANYKRFKLSATSRTALENQQSQAYQSASSRQYEVTQGSLPPPDGSITTWIQTSQSSPYPISFTLKLLYSLLNPTRIPSDPNIAKKQSLLQQALSNFCNVLQGCTGARRGNLIPSAVRRYSTSIKKRQAVHCPFGYTAISCGINNREHEGWWAVYPNGGDACVCYNYFLADCYAVCVHSSLLVGFQVTRHDFSGSGTFQCPAGKKVVGCGLENGGSTSEGWPKVYPSSPTSCTCYNFFGGTCVLSCVSNVNRVVVYNHYTKGIARATCSDANSVAFGCGIILSGKPREAFPNFYLSNYNQCQAYGFFGVTSYAVCGQLDTSHIPQNVLEQYDYRYLLISASESKVLN